jgi:hypothetical protein
VRAPDLLLDHRPLAVEFDGVDEGAQDHVRNHLDAGLGALEGEVVPVAGDLLRGVGVQAAARAFDRLGDLGGGRASLGALEEHVFDEVRQAIGARRLVAGADARKKGDGRGLGDGHRRDHDAQAVVEGDNFRVAAQGDAVHSLGVVAGTQPTIGISEAL